MPELTVAQIILIVCVALFTLAAAYCDFRWRKIPNYLTLPMFGVGWVYQMGFFGLPGLGDAALGFLIGFGLLFVLWMIGGGGGGDVKLMGALSVWLGFQMTLFVLISSTVFVVLGTFCVMLVSTLFRGARKTKDAYVENSEKWQSLQNRQKRRIMAFAIPVALGTWVVLYQALILGA